jgi:hypothetical protein
VGSERSERERKERESERRIEEGIAPDDVLPLIECNGLKGARELR